MNYCWKLHYFGKIAGGHFIQVKVRKACYPEFIDFSLLNAQIYFSKCLIFCHLHHPHLLLKSVIFLIFYTCVICCDFLIFRLLGWYPQ